MAVATSVDEKFVGQINAVVSLGGVELHVLEGDYSPEGMNDDMTGTQSGGFYEDVGTIKKTTGTTTWGYKGATAPPIYEENGIYEYIVDMPGANYFKGNIRINKVKYPGANVKQGVKIQAEWTTFGAYTKVRPS